MAIVQGGLPSLLLSDDEAFVKVDTLAQITTAYILSGVLIISAQFHCYPPPLQWII